MSDCIARIDRLTNGFTVEVWDEKIAAENRKPKTDYKDPWKEYAFSSKEEVIAFLTAHLDSLKAPPGPEVEYADSFSEATKKDS